MIGISDRAIGIILNFELFQSCLASAEWTEGIFLNWQPHRGSHPIF